MSRALGKIHGVQWTSGITGVPTYPGGTKDPA